MIDIVCYNSNITQKMHSLSGGAFEIFNFLAITEGKKKIFDHINFQTVHSHQFLLFDINN